jgi:hypothetical protein
VCSACFPPMFFTSVGKFYLYLSSSLISSYSSRGFVFLRITRGLVQFRDVFMCYSVCTRFFTFRPHYGPGVDSVFDRNEYQEYFLGGKGGRCLGLTNLSPSCAECLEILQPQIPGTLRACTGLCRG